MQGLMPIDPEEQKARIIAKYEREFADASYLFTDLIKIRTINLMKFVMNADFDSLVSN